MINALENYEVFVRGSGVIYTQGNNVALHFFLSKKDLYNSWNMCLINDPRNTIST